MLDKIFEGHHSDIVAQEGQHAIYHEINTLLSRTKYNIINAFISSSELECNEKLEKIHSTLTKERMSSLPSDGHKSCIDSLLMHVAILLEKPSSNGNVTNKILEEYSTLTQLNYDLMIIKIEILGYQCCSTTDEKNKNKNSLYEMKCKIVNSFEESAVEEYEKKTI